MMSDKAATNVSSVIAPDASQEQSPGEATPGFFKRYRLPLTLAVVAVCLYAGSILYILLGRGQIV